MKYLPAFKLSYLKNCLKYGLATLAFILVAAWSFWLNQPRGKLTQFLVNNVVAKLPAGGWQIDISNAEPLWNGIRLEKLVVQSSIPEVNSRIGKILIKELSINLLSWRSFLFQVTFFVDVYQGEVNGYYSWWNNEVKLRGWSINLHTVPALRWPKILVQQVPMDFELDYSLATNNWRAQIFVKNLLLNGSNDYLAKLPFSFPNKVFFGQIQANVLFTPAAKRLEVRTNGDFTGEVNGVVLWKDSWVTSQYDVNIQGSLTQRLVDSSADAVNFLLQPYLVGNKLNAKLTFQGNFSDFQFKKI